MLTHGLSVKAVYLGEVGEIDEVDRGLDHLGEARAASGKDRREVVEDSGGLGFEAAVDERFGFGIDADLARRV